MNSLADLLKKSGFTATERPPEPVLDPTAPPPPAFTFAPKVVLHISRKGRGGKTVTLIEGVTGGQDRLAKELRAALGVGVVAEDDTLVAQGDQRDRLEKLLADRGARRVVR